VSWRRGGGSRRDPTRWCQLGKVPADQPPRSRRRPAPAHPPARPSAPAAWRRCGGSRRDPRGRVSPGGNAPTSPRDRVGHPARLPGPAALLAPTHPLPTCTALPTRPTCASPPAPATSAGASSRAGSLVAYRSVLVPSGCSTCGRVGPVFAHPSSPARSGAMSRSLTASVRPTRSGFGLFSLRLAARSAVRAGPLLIHASSPAWSGATRPSRPFPFGPAYAYRPAHPAAPAPSLRARSRSRRGV
jgi:hypothetical protein